MNPEENYIKTVDHSHRKKYAQFFTPGRIADFMAKWVLEKNRGKTDILEPAFGLGIFSRSLLKYNSDCNITGYDIDDVIFTRAKDLFKGNNSVSLHLTDYLTSEWESKYDAIICNPPYFKFHDYDNASFVPYINGKLHTHLTGFTNIYALFLLKSLSQLKPGGRLAYIVPSEFLNSDYGVEVKRTLLQSRTLRHLIIVDFTQNAFDDALTTACIILCENTGEEIPHVRFSTVYDPANLNPALQSYNTVPAAELNAETKWRRYYEIPAASRFCNLVPFSTYAKVSRGIATGANSYFTFNLDKVRSHRIPPEALMPCICHCSDIKRRCFSDEDMIKLSITGKNVFLFSGVGQEENPEVMSYISLGEREGVNRKYLTSSRNPWYSIENRPPAPIWVSVFNRNGLRFVRNRSHVRNLTTFHCIYPTGLVDTDILFAYLCTPMARDIFYDNSRQYGNGLIKFEPNDLNKGKVVNLKLLNDEEKDFVKKISLEIYNSNTTADNLIETLDAFFREKYGMPDAKAV